MAKFQSEFSRVCRDLETEADIIDHLTFLKILEDLGFSTSIKDTGTKLVQKMWGILSVNGENIKKQSLFNFLCYMLALPVSGT